MLSLLQLLMVGLVLFCAMAQAEEPMRASQSGELQIHGSIDKVFPLFTPKGELLWIPTWKYTPVYPASGETERDMVFRTDEGETTWTLAVYEPPNKSVYVLMNENLVGRIQVECRSVSANETAMRITYTWTALTEKGRNHFASQEEFDTKMKRWQGWLDEYFKK